MIVVTLLRKPLSRRDTVASNSLSMGTGGINIDATRIRTTDNLNGGTYSHGGNKSPLPGDFRGPKSAGMFAEGEGRLPGQYVQPTGRYPANLILTESVTKLLDDSARFFKHVRLES